MMKERLQAYMQGYCQWLEGLIDRLEDARATTAPMLEEALVDWANKTKEDAIKNLDKPNWLLSRSITDKVTAYQKGKKLWSMVGFRFQEKNPRDPGFYGQYHEAGWVKPPRTKLSANHHFIRRAKLKNENELRKRIKDIMSDRAKLIKGEK